MTLDTQSSSEDFNARNRANSDRLRWVRENMPQESLDALDSFMYRNPSYRGAGWDDVLDMLLDSDSHLELTERLWDEMEGEPLSSYIGVTLLYAKRWYITADEVRAVLERAG